LDRLEARGEARGEAKGIKEGIEKVARNLLKEGMDPIFVAKVTGLPEEEARKLAGQ
jgi:predicted transposase YdaD